MKIQSKRITKQYKTGTYSYKQHLLPFPVARNQELEPFLKKQLTFNMTTKGDTLNLSLKKQENRRTEINRRGCDSIVKFRERKMKKRYKKNREYIYTKYLLEFPAKANKKIEPLKAKIFNDLDITTEETANEELVNIKLVRYKPAKENKQKPEKTAPFVLNPKEKRKLEANRMR